MLGVFLGDGGVSTVLLVCFGVVGGVLRGGNVSGVGVGVFLLAKKTRPGRGSSGRAVFVT